MDNNGAVAWIKEQALMNTSGTDTVPTIAVTPAGGIYVSYQTLGTVSGGVQSGGSDIVVFQMLQTPEPPTAVTASAGSALAVVSFTAPTYTGGSSSLTFTVTSSPDGHIGTGSASPITVTSLTNGVAYTFTVTATNAVGTSSASSASAPVVPTLLPAPANLSASSPSTNTAVVQWDAVIGSTPLTQYVVTILPIRTTVTVLNNATEVTITGMTARIYTFTVRAETPGIGVSATSNESNTVRVEDNTSNYTFVLLNAPCKFQVFSAFQIVATP
jgi:hypothetical protein